MLPVGWRQAPDPAGARPSRRPDGAGGRPPVSCGSMEFVEPEDEPGRFRNPLPPDDRLWRHPSEMGAGPPSARPASGASAGTVAAGRQRPFGGAGGRRRVRPSMWLVAAVSAVSAGLLATGLALVAVGLVGADDQLRPAVERQMEPRPIDAVVARRRRRRRRPGPARDRPAPRRRRAATVVGSGVIFRSDGHMLTNASRGRRRHVRRGSCSTAAGRSPAGSSAPTPTPTPRWSRSTARPFPAAVLGTAADLKVGQAGDRHRLAARAGRGAVGHRRRGQRPAPLASARAPTAGCSSTWCRPTPRCPPGRRAAPCSTSTGSVIGITTAVAHDRRPAPRASASPPRSTLARVGGRAAHRHRQGRRTCGSASRASDLDGSTRRRARRRRRGGGRARSRPGARPSGPAWPPATSSSGVDGRAGDLDGQLVVALAPHRPGDAVHARRHPGRRSSMSMVVVLVERPAPA